MTTRSRSRATRMSVAIGLAMVAGACSSSDDATPAPEPAVTSESESATTTTAATTTTSTTVAETTTTESTTTTSTEAPATTEPPAPVTTNFDPTTIEGEVEAAIIADSVDYAACLSALPDCDPATALPRSVGSFAESTSSYIDSLKSDGRQVRQTEQLSVEVESVLPAPDGSAALAQVCVRDATVIFRPATQAESEQVTDDTVGLFRLEYTVALVDGVWSIADSELLESDSGSGSSLCG